MEVNFRVYGLCEPRVVFLSVKPLRKPKLTDNGLLALDDSPLAYPLPPGGFAAVSLGDVVVMSSIFNVVFGTIERMQRTGRPCTRDDAAE